MRADNTQKCLHIIQNRGKNELRNRFVFTILFRFVHFFDFGTYNITTTRLGISVYCLLSLDSPSESFPLCDINIV